MAIIRLRKIQAEDLPLFYRWNQTDAAFGEYDEPALYSFEQIKSRFNDNAFLSDSRGTLLIIREDNDEPIGFVEYFQHPVDRWVMWCSVIIAVPEMRGKGYGTLAHKHLVDYIFAKFEGIDKIEAWTDVENTAEKRALVKARFRYEGSLRARNKLRRQYRDMAVYGLLRNEFQEPE